MEDCLHTTSESLSSLVRWAHSHGTICSLIPGLKPLLTQGSHGNLTAMWGCGAGHAYHWPLSAPCRPGQKERLCYQDNRSVLGEAGAPPNPGAERFLARPSKAKGGSTQTRDSFSNCSEPSEADDNTEEFSSNLFDMACESSATDEDGEYEPRPPPRKREGPGGADERPVKRIKQEMAEHYYSVAPPDSDPKPGSSTRPALGHALTTPHKPSSGDYLAASSPLLPQPLPQPSPRHQEQSRPEESRPPCAAPPGLTSDLPPGLTSDLPPGLNSDLPPGLMSPELDLLAEHALGGGVDALGDAAAGPAGEVHRLRLLLRAERSRSDLLGETISCLKQDKELLQQELTKKAELICDFLQDQLRPDKRRTHPSNHMEPGSSHMVPFVEEAAFDSPALFDSFEEVELHPLDRHRGLKTKRSREGENTRVRMKNVVGVIARYMAALQEFRRSVSMKVAFDRVGVDRNTISRTAAIAELSLAAPEVFHALAPWDEKEETLAHYAHRCRQAMDDNIKAKIKSMKAKGDLLPIVSK